MQENEKADRADLYPGGTLSAACMAFRQMKEKINKPTEREEIYHENNCRAVPGIWRSAGSSSE